MLPAAVTTFTMSAPRLTHIPYISSSSSIQGVERKSWKETMKRPLRECIFSLTSSERLFGVSISTSTYSTSPNETIPRTSDRKRLPFSPRQVSIFGHSILHRSPAVTSGEKPHRSARSSTISSIFAAEMHSSGAGYIRLVQITAIFCPR